MGRFLGCIRDKSNKKDDQLVEMELRLNRMEDELNRQQDRQEQQEQLDIDQDGRITESEYQQEIARLRTKLNDANIKLDECQTLINYMEGDGIPRTIDISSEAIRAYVDEKIVADSQTNFGWLPDSIESKTWTILFKEMLTAAGGMSMDIAGHTLQVNITHK